MNSELTESEAHGHFTHWIGTASDAARAAIVDMRGPLRFRLAMRNAQGALRAVALLRSDPRWLMMSRNLQPLISHAPAWRLGDLRWSQIAENLKRVKVLADQTYAARADKEAVGYLTATMKPEFDA